MRGDQLARQWRVIRAIEASPGGLTVAEIAKREETGIRTIYRDLEALQAAGFPLYTERVERATRWAFIDTFKFKIPPIVSRKVAKFAKKTVSHLPAQNIYLVQFLCSQRWRKGPLRSLRLGVRRKSSTRAPKDHQIQHGSLEIRFRVAGAGNSEVTLPR